MPSISPTLSRASSARAWQLSPWTLLALRRPGLLLAGLFVLFLLIASIVPSWLVHTDPFAVSARDAFRGPSAAHWLGTDENGRDVLARLIYGVRNSLLLGISASLIALLGGSFLGLLAGLGKRWLDTLLMRLIDVLSAFPDLLLVLLIITFWGGGLVNTVLALGVAGIPRFARIVRAQTQLVRRAPYVEAALTLGLPRFTVVVRHVLPNAIRPVLILATISVGGNIVIGSLLSFLGFGAPPPTPEWGAMLAVGYGYMANAWWLVVAPSVLVMLTVLAITALGRTLLRYSEGKGL
ncbi:ABC transporter permease [Pseudomonas sp. 5P_3.1_Bac2]|uniref:ABC transporter permease n=1 Tax=Pseudomonas sp. 5P_3.1_Bac2 TaxID=2971617 RepID=UPI0021C5E86E|nr:ABC transporter permease [Pseudomonas sp. 5P_3.1_Bac2]MCU1717229.1 ABC transporter permease [Pseudomonas sp. 5P_3.1_Bac2]